MISNHSRLVFTALALLAARNAPPCFGREAVSAKGETVLVCGSLDGFEGPDVPLALGTLTQILRQAGVKLNWRNGTKACAVAGDGIIVSTSQATPVSKNPAALASASVYQGTNVVVFADRLKRRFSPDQVGVILGHVLAHEIVHMLQGVDRHSEEGLMRATWRSEDYLQMRQRPMAIPEEDLHFIRDGMKVRKSLAAERAAQSTGN